MLLFYFSSKHKNLMLHAAFFNCPEVTNFVIIYILLLKLCIYIHIVYVKHTVIHTSSDTFGEVI